MPSEAEQRAVCVRVGTLFVPPSSFEKVGIALSTLPEQPLNGLRLAPEHGTCGWYIWGGREWSEDPAPVPRPSAWLPIHHRSRLRGRLGGPGAAGDLS
jgi:hypothetical protein